MFGSVSVGSLTKTQVPLFHCSSQLKRSRGLVFWPLVVVFLRISSAVCIPQCFYDVICTPLGSWLAQKQVVPDGSLGRPPRNAPANSTPRLSPSLQRSLMLPSYPQPAQYSMYTDAHLLSQLRAFTGGLVGLTLSPLWPWALRTECLA